MKPPLYTIIYSMRIEHDFIHNSAQYGEQHGDARPIYACNLGAYLHIVYIQLTVDHDGEYKCPETH